jgi:hypothetical protein
VIRFLQLLSLISLAWGLSLASAAPASSTRVLPSEWRVVERESGPVNYYAVFKDAAPPFIRAHYRPPLKTMVLGYEVPEGERRASRVRWSWRALVLPTNANECEKGKSDSAAVVYLSWRRGLRWYTLKYVWSAAAPRGAVCESVRNPFVAQDTVILESGGPLNTWKIEHVDLKAQFRKHFADGDRDAEVPDFVGIGIMSDGDQTRSESAADYAEFSIER